MTGLKRGKFYLLSESHNLWKLDTKAPDRIGNFSRRVIPPLSLVQFIGFGRFRYVQVIHQDMTGFIWCNTNIPVYEHFQEVNLEIDFPLLQCTSPSKRGVIRS